MGFKSYLQSGGLNTHILCQVVWNHCCYYVLTCRVLDLVYLLEFWIWSICTISCQHSLLLTFIIVLETVTFSRFPKQILLANVRFFILAVRLYLSNIPKYTRLKLNHCSIQEIICSIQKTDMLIQRSVCGEVSTSFINSCLSYFIFPYPFIARCFS